LAIAANAGELGAARRADLAVRLAPRLITKHDRGATRRLHANADRDDFVVVDRLVVTAQELHDLQQVAVVFDLAIAAAALSHPLGARLLKPRDVATVMGDCHAVGFTVANAHPVRRLVEVRHRWQHYRTSLSAPAVPVRALPQPATAHS